MSARKLQQEFDKTNKKIAEGLTAFDDIYEKLMSSEISSQKEKLESDLKKEIKKLQRLRDLLKTWLSDSSIKLDKNQLQENRTKIERAMDQFKDLEKSSKIKQFSNEGLELQSQKSSRFSRPEDAKKEEACNYISDVIEQLNQQNESLEAEIHQLLSQLKKAKSSNVNSIQSNIDDERYKVERNILHLTTLEKILRNLENEKLDPEKIDDIKDDLEYYIENNQEDDYIEYDEFYDVLEMSDDIVDDVQGSLAVSHLDDVEEELENEKQPEKEKEKGTPKEKETPKKVEPVKATPAKVANSEESVAGNVGSTPVKKTKTFVTPALNPPPPLASYSNIIKNATSAKAPPPGFKSATASPAPTSITPVKVPSPAAASVTTPVVSAAVPPVSNTAVSTTPAATVAATEGASVSPASDDKNIDVIEGKTFLDTLPRLSTIPQSRLNNPLPFQAINQLLESSLLNCPDSFDAEKPRQYIPVNTHPSSVDFPQEPMYELNSTNMMEKFDNDTLFFCFYYSVGVDSLAKWNAAKELSRRGWFFNDSLKQWFSKDNNRNQSVTTIVKDEVNTNDNNDGENFKYFDYEKTWLTRRRENYKFLPELRETF